MSSDTTPTRGVMWTATKHQCYVQQASVSAASVKRHTELPTCLFTDLPARGFDQVILCKAHEVDHNQYMLDRLVNLPATPFEQTLALDTDTFVMEDITEMFEVLDEFDIAMVHGHNREQRHQLAVQAGHTTVPRAFAPLQGGLILYRRNKRVWSYLNALIEMYQEKQYFDDQISMRELLFRRSDLRFYVLPREYNFSSGKDLARWAVFGWKEARPKIFHYTRHKHNWKEVVRRYDTGAFEAHSRAHK